MKTVKIAILYMLITYITLYLSYALALVYENVIISGNIFRSTSFLNPFDIYANTVIVGYFVMFSPFFLIFKLKNMGRLYVKYFLYSILYSLLLGFILLALAGGALNFLLSWLQLSLMYFLILVLIFFVFNFLEKNLIKR